MEIDYWRLRIGLAVLCFYSKTGFWPSYWQISTDLDNILHIPIVIRNTLVGRRRPRSARGRLQAKPKRLMFFFCNTCNGHPKSYIETTDRCDFGGKPSKWRWGRVLSWKMPEFCSVGGARSKNSIFRVFTVPFDYPAHSIIGNSFTPNQWYRWKAETLKVCLESLWPGIWQI